MPLTASRILAPTTSLNHSMIWSDSRSPSIDPAGRRHLSSAAVIGIVIAVALLTLVVASLVSIVVRRCWQRHQRKHSPARIYSVARDVENLNHILLDPARSPWSGGVGGSPDSGTCLWAEEGMMEGLRSPALSPCFLPPYERAAIRS